MITVVVRSPAFRFAVGGTILAFLVWRVGAAPFIDGLRMVDAPSLIAALLIGAITTTCCAWRWRVVSRGLGIDVPLGQATAAYYRSIFLNSTLPGGVIGDVHRAVRHGRDAGDVGRGVRSVAWERSAGQVVQIAITAIALLLLPSPIRAWIPTAVIGLAVLALVVFALSRLHRVNGVSRTAGIARTAAVDLRDGLLARSAWPAVLLASAIVVVGHTATFLIAARTAGIDATAVELLPLALIVLAVSALPLSIAGWGPREGMAAWAFAAAGLGAAAGVTTAVVFAVLALAASLPGLLVLIAAGLRSQPVPTEEVVHG